MIAPWRRACQTAALLLLILVPLINRAGHVWIQGGYQSLGVGPLWFISPLEGLETMLTARAVHPGLAVGLAVPVIAAVLLGRVFCSWVCPVNTLQVWSDALLRRSGSQDRVKVPARLIGAVLVVHLVLVAALRIPLFSIGSPPGLVGRELANVLLFGAPGLGGVVVGAVLVLNLFTRRLFCRGLCPLGGLLAFLGRGRVLGIRHEGVTGVACRRCDRACPLGLEPSRGGGAAARCWNCGRCADVCLTGGLSLGWGRPAGACEEVQESNLQALRKELP